METLERKGLVAYALQIDDDFTKPGHDGKGLILNKQSRLITLRLKRDVENYGLMRTKGMKPGGRVNIRSHIQEELNNDLGTQKNDPECPNQVPATLTKVNPNYYELSLNSSIVPHFLNQDFLAKPNDRNQYYIVAESYLANAIEEVNVTIPTILKENLHYINHGPLEFVLSSWDNPIPKSPEIEPETRPEKKLFQPDIQEAKPKTKSKRKRKRSANLSNDDAKILAALNREKTESKKNHNILSERHGLKKLFNPQIANENSMLEAITETFNMFPGQAPPVTIVHGPPGTGKTTVTAEIILQINNKYPEKQILVVAPSHTATDNITAAMSKHLPEDQKKLIFRVGNDEKVLDKNVRKYHTASELEDTKECFHGAFCNAVSLMPDSYSIVARHNENLI